MVVNVHFGNQRAWTRSADSLRNTLDENDPNYLLLVPSPKVPSYVYLLSDWPVPDLCLAPVRDLAFFPFLLLPFTFIRPTLFSLANPNLSNLVVLNL